MTAIGHIYKIICLVDSKFCYIGSTFKKLNKRFKQHFDDFIKWLHGDNKMIMSCFPFYEKYGIENFKIILIKSYEVCKAHNKDNKHLWAYETLWINKTKCCNLRLPIHYLKKQREKWRHKKYRQNNVKKIKEYRKNNSKKIKERNSEKVECNFCKSIVQKCSLPRHHKSKKCLATQ